MPANPTFEMSGELPFRPQVTKERLAELMKAPKKPTPAPEKEDITSLTFLHDLLKRREEALFMAVGGAMMKAGKDGVFDAWMYEQSDAIQAAAKAYGERLISEQFAQTVENAQSSVKVPLTLLYHLYLLNCVQRDLGGILTKGLLSPKSAAKVGVFLLCYRDGTGPTSIRVQLMNAYVKIKVKARVGLEHFKIKTLTIFIFTDKAIFVKLTKHIL